MKNHHKILSVLSIASLSVTGCSNLTPEQNGAISGILGGGASAVILATTGVKPQWTVPISLASGALVGGFTYVIAKHQADEHQKRLAEERARKYYANLSVEQKKSVGKKLIVKTAKTQGTAGDSVMMYDIKNDKVTDTVYSVKKVPEVGEKSTMISSSPATYIGIGS
jgi:hypothetical protein